MPFSEFRKVLRAPDRGGGKPAKVKRSVGRPDEASAAIGADAPGIAMTLMPNAAASRTSLKPGSDTKGVPASEISAMRAPACNSLSSAGRACAPLWS